MGERTGGLVLLAGGGTGGHVTPALATAEALSAGPEALRCAFVVRPDSLEEQMVTAAGWPVHQVDVLPVQRRLTPANLRVPVVLARSVRRLRRLLAAEGAVAAVCFGGYVAAPLGLAAPRAGVPLVVHEQNAVPGLANRIIARRAAAIAVSWPGTAAFGRASATRQLTGSPPRPSTVAIDRAALRGAAAEAFGLDPDATTVLVTGGSQGAVSVNEAISAAAADLADAGLQVLHIAGRRNHDAAAARWGATDPAPRVACVGFTTRMDLAYALADIVVCRAGASTLAEVTALGLPSVLVPYPHATADHQSANARSIEAAGAAVVVPDAEVDGPRLAAAVRSLTDDPARLATAGERARSLGRADAAEAVADMVRAAVSGRLRGPGGGVREDGST